MSNCSICLEDLNNENTEAVALRCYHTYHNKCIQAWYEKSKTVACPECKRDANVPVGEESINEYDDNEEKSYAVALEMLAIDHNAIMEQRLRELGIPNREEREANFHKYVVRRNYIIRGRLFMLFVSLILGLFVPVNEKYEVCHNNEISYGCNSVKEYEIVYACLSAIVVYFIYKCISSPNDETSDGILDESCSCCLLGIIELGLCVAGLIIKYTKTCAYEFDCANDSTYCAKCTEVLAYNINPIHSSFILLASAVGVITVIAHSVVTHKFGEGRYLDNS
jgi:hypothetical protein